MCDSAIKLIDEMPLDEIDRSLANRGGVIG
jgi:hypothetical protein